MEVNAAVLIQVTGEATREVQWNVTPDMVAFMYATMVIGIAVFAYGTWRHIRVWRIGKPEMRWDRPLYRARRVLVQAIGQAALLKERLPGIMHALLFYGFVVLFLATVVVWIHDTLGIPIMQGHFYLYFQSLTVNAFGALAMAGVGIAVYRRYLLRLPRLEHGKWADAALLLSLFVLLATGFLLSGLRITVTEDPWAIWRPFSYGFGLAAAAIWRDPAGLERAHAWTWTIHVALWHMFVAVIPFTKMFHMVSSTLNVFTSNLGTRGLVAVIDFNELEEADGLGVATPFDLTWKQLLDLDACTECGRCQSVCPAWAEGKPLSPKRVILDIRDYVRQSEPLLLELAAQRRAGDDEAFTEARGALSPLAGGVIRPETLWACTTCGACEEACPVSIEHVRLIIELRQNLAMEQADVPQGLEETVTNLEQRFHPFRGVPGDRSAWYQDIVTPGAPTAD
jgi:ferredoxin